ncbi:MAG: acyltransferase [Lachnospiraceae bacterium]|nr:acyltransferase [Lachnospiraceae bacterium]
MKSLKDYLRLIPKGDKRDSSVELLRIYACFLVIFAHIQLGYIKADGGVNTPALMMKCLLSDNVPIFFTILGYYLFTRVQGEDRLSAIPKVYLSKIKSFLVRVYVPTVIVTILVCFAYSWIYRQKTFGELFTSPDANWELLKNYVLLQSPTDMVGQFWYIVAYIKLLIFFPFYAVICVDKKPYNIIRRGYMIFAFFTIAIADFCFLNQTATSPDFSGYILDTNLLFLLIGYEVNLFFKKTKLSRKAQIIVSACIFLLGFLLRYGLTKVDFDIYGVGNNGHFFVMECSLVYISSCGALMFFVSVFKGLKSGIIQFLGEMTLYVFMLHGVMIRFFGETGSKILTKMNGGDTGIHVLGYYLLYGGLLYITSMLVGIVIRELYALARYGCAVAWNKRGKAEEKAKEN